MYFEELVAAYDKARAERNVFHDLMRYRVREVLLVASLYDSFIVESDGVLTEQIYGEYYKLNLSAVPRITCAYSPEDAIAYFATGRFDLVILMAGLDFDRPLALARAMKERQAEVTVLLMVTNNSALSALDMGRPELGSVDRVFVWNGYSKLFIGMIRHVEDLRNVDADTRTGMAKVILLIEDSVRYYSRYLPLLYQVVLRQTQSLIEEERGGETWKLLRSRARPKVLLASSYEEAARLFELYEPYILTVITDIRFPRGGVLDPEAGFDFIRMAKSRIVDLPVMIQSSEAEVRERAWALDASFADKSSESLEHQLAAYLQTSLGFGSFKFRSPTGELIGEAQDLEEFLARLHDVPPESVVFHASRNHFSAWLMARGEIQFARLLRPYQVEDFGSAFHLKDFILRFIDRAVRERSRGAVPYFDGGSCRDENCAVRLGDGSVGGKGRGITFLRSLLDNFDFARHIEGLELKVPRSAFIGIDEFERFLEQNGLWAYAFYQASSEEVRSRFLEAPLSATLVDRLRRFAEYSAKPLAVRSSGLFEDMLMVPFSGIYATYILPNSDPDPERRLAQLCDAVRLIYASLFSERARAYFDTAGYKLEEERMAVVVQELAGSRHGR
ncbi:MAG TPA: PEP/pyruvate-binding domain-containing protein, partial [Rectinemataceae bacterium]|nr:PEP/pyruvate-binding domain-containing protein [Rectinemataceae bacterium]